MDDQRRMIFEAELADHIRKRDDENKIIVALSTLLGKEAPDGGAQVSEPSTMPTAVPGADPVTLVRPGEFFRMSSTKAAKAILERAGYRNAIKTELLLAAIQKGGLSIKGGGPQLYKNLWRDDDFQNLGKSIGWGLSTWYGGKVKKSVDEAPKSKRRKHTGPKRQTKPKTTEAATNEPAKAKSDEP